MEKAKIRLHVEHHLGQGQPLPLNEAQAHYLVSVMRQGVGARVTVFNGTDGEWQAEITRAAKRGGDLVCVAQSGPQLSPPDLWLLFAPIKKARTDFIVEKATELGVAAIFPVQTRFTNSERLRQDKLQAHAVEAAEQCGGTYVPMVHDIQNIWKVLDNWVVTGQSVRQILWADKSLVGAGETLEALAERASTFATGPQPWAILIGPEGGFSTTEREKLRALPFVHPISLGPRILRADTAVCAAVTLWQTALGDWA
ncbi:16S rRNA (uracil(1498)-N(3))-methyltransferase [Albirhodobacter sp. R86504]|uniref:16S rRNA (uracil(1498)-N(3))-methyltransferase n=1 Tax=Albirhodobacter sp. R86504 TaxID=3093848 RepID=UPI0036710606